MNENGDNGERAKAIIRNACEMLQLTRESAPVFVGGWHDLSADFYVLLLDATRLLCRAVSAQQGEEPGHRWSPALPELLLAHPERCEETLALIERKEFQEVSFFQFANA